MNNIIEHIKARRSVRTYDGSTLSNEHRKSLESFMESVINPFDIPVKLKFLDGKENGLQCPVASGVDLFVAGKVQDVPNASLAFGYSFESFILFAQSLGLGTVWLGGTMNRPAFEKAMELKENEIMPCASPIGKAAKKMSIRESMMRKAIKADERFPFEELFYCGSFDKPLRIESAGSLAHPLEMVRLAPSAVNKQPWRILVDNNNVHFYLKRSKGFNYNAKLDMQMIDMGIALCHFSLAAEEFGMKLSFCQLESPLSHPDLEYIATFTVL